MPHDLSAHALQMPQLCCAPSPDSLGVVTGTTAAAGRAIRSQVTDVNAGCRSIVTANRCAVAASLAYSQVVGGRSIA
jgi:hypothetical protein